MKASELISALAEAITEYGDQIVFIQESYKERPVKWADSTGEKIFIQY